MASELLKREEVPVEHTWNLSDMYETVSDWETMMDEIEELIDEIETMEETCTNSASDLLLLLERYADAEQKLSLAYNYAERLYDEDRKNTTHQAMSAKAGTLYAKFVGKTAFIQPTILELSAETLESFYNVLPSLELYRKFIDEILRFREHSLSTEMEKLVALTSEMSQGPSNTFSILNNADLQFPEIEDEKGEKTRITHGRYINFMESANRDVRKNAFEGMYGTYEQFLNTIASIYDSQVKQQIFQAKAHKYETSLEASVDSNNVSPDVYKNLIETINKNLGKMHRYVALRKKCLGLDDLHMYDIYTPMIPDMAKEIPFEEAKETVLKALAPLGEDYVAKVKEGFENRWIDVYENQGKRSGAYSAGVYGTHPYVLLNYNGSLDNMFTLAHEMGHAMHSYYSNENQPYIYSQYKIFVAEVASTCNEILLMEYLLKNTTDKKERAYLLNHYIDSFKGTVFRQTQFAEFEMRTNAMVEAGESLNAQNLSDLYLELNKKYYGPDMISDKQISYEWAKIPHFYYNFYVYQYATGFTSAVAIAQSILREGAPAVERYKKFLSGGCSDAPVELLKIAGVNLETPAPIQSALDVMDEILDEMEALL